MANKRCLESTCSVGLPHHYAGDVGFVVHFASSDRCICGSCSRRDQRRLRPVLLASQALSLGQHRAMDCCMGLVDVFCEQRIEKAIVWLIVARWSPPCAACSRWGPPCYFLFEFRIRFHWWLIVVRWSPPYVACPQWGQPCYFLLEFRIRFHWRLIVVRWSPPYVACPRWGPPCYFGLTA